MTRKEICTGLLDRLVIWSSSHPIIAAFLCGILATLTLPPFYLFPLVVPAYGGLFYLLNKATSARQAAKYGFFWGWGFYITGLYWFCIALLTDPEKFAWLIPFTLLGLTAVIALYQTVFAAAYWSLSRWVSRSLSLPRDQETKRPRDFFLSLLFASLWILIEYARGHLFTGFPWNLGGYVFGVSDASIQLASLVGIYGLTFITVLLGVIVIAHRRAAALCYITFIAALGWGAWRAHTAPQDVVKDVTLRLVQANIPQQHKWDPERQMEGLRTYISLSQSVGREKITHVIWPETAVPYVMTANSTLAKRLGETLLPGQHLITGVLRMQDDNAYNSIAVIDNNGIITGYYDKHKLVPFGEFLPLRRFIPDMLTTPVGMTDLAKGESAQTLAWPGLPDVSPLICYEVIFPEETMGVGKKPAWLLSVTNDAWFGASSGPYQHLAAARMRAVEQGLPMVRVANTGITAVYDAYGRKVVNILLNKQGVVDVALPAQSQYNTVYSRYLHGK